MVENPLRKAEADHAIVARTHCNEKCHFRVFEFLETLIQVFLVFQKFTLHHFPFMKDLHWHLCSVSEKFEEDFHFYGKKKKGKKQKSIQSSFCSKPLQRQHRPRAGRMALASSFPRNYTPHLASSCFSSELCLYAFVLYFDLFCASLNKIFPEVTASSLEASLTYKRFHRNPLTGQCGKPVLEISEWTASVLIHN